MQLDEKKFSGVVGDDVCEIPLKLPICPRGWLSTQPKVAWDAGRAPQPHSRPRVPTVSIAIPADEWSTPAKSAQREQHSAMGARPR
jgi:hypothetical protein